MGGKSLGGNNAAGQWVCGHSCPAFPASAVFMCHSHAGCLLAVYLEMYNRLCQSGTRYSTNLTVSVIFYLSLK